jgi:midasin
MFLIITKGFFLRRISFQKSENGHFLVLDELNLAPYEVLEALNRLLDDNQELYTPEIQTTIIPHKNFRMLQLRILQL